MSRKERRNTQPKPQKKGTANKARPFQLPFLRRTTPHVSLPGSNPDMDAMIQQAIEQMQAAKNMTPEERQDKWITDELAKLQSRIINSDGMNPYAAQGYALIYHDLAWGDEVLPIDVRRVQRFIEEVVREDNSEMYSNIRLYYGLDGENHLSEQEMNQLSERIKPYWNSMRSFENAMIYCPHFEEAVNKIAPKLNAPESMSAVERAKWAVRIWLFVLRNTWFFWTDFAPDGLHVIPERILHTNKTYFHPESVIRLYDEYFSQLEDGELLYDIMKEFIDSYPEDVREVVYRYAELDGNPYVEDWSCGRIRTEIKKPLFYNSWNSNMICLMTLHGLTKIEVDSFKQAVIASKTGYDNLPVSSNHTVLNTFADKLPMGQLLIHKRKFGETVINGKPTELCFSSKQELGLYTIVYTWLQNHPDTLFGSESKTLAEYGMRDVFFNADNAISTWICASQYAKSPDDINWDLAHTLFDSDELTEKLKLYWNGILDESDIYAAIGFNSENLARMCLSFSGLRYFEKMPAEQALKRVKMFGLEHSLVSDKLYVKLYRYLQESGHPCGEKNIPVSAYGIRYAV